MSLKHRETKIRFADTDELSPPSSTIILPRLSSSSSSNDYQSITSVEESNKNNDKKRWKSLKRLFRTKSSSETQKKKNRSSSDGVLIDDSTFSERKSDPAIRVRKNSNKKKNDSHKKQKEKLANYLRTESAIVPKTNHVLIDDEDRMLLDKISDYDPGAVDLDKYFKAPVMKAKDKLWKIPYRFSNDDSCDNDSTSITRTINRFGEGVSDGCKIGLSLPKIYSKKDLQEFKSWDELLESSDQVLDKFTNAQWSRLNRNRRGSILQPRHVFLSPNPDVGRGERFLLTNKTLKEWSSELFINNSSEELLDSNYRTNILQNVSINDLSHMIYPELKLSFNEYGLMSESDTRYIQAVSKRRRQSLVPPTLASGGENMSFRRQSYGGGQLWSAEVENDAQREIYQQKLALINPDFKPRINERRLESITTLISEIDLNNQFDDDNSLAENYPQFDPDSEEQTRIFAFELTLIIRKYFNSIKSSEIINFMTITNQKAMNACSHINELLHFQNRIVRLIATYILHIDELQDRVRSILFFIRVIEHLHRLENWHSVCLVTQSLQCPPVVRMKETWRKITFNHPEEYSFFIQISEDLEAGRQWDTYETCTRFIPIFDDVIEMIKERCGLMIVQIGQHRFYRQWSQVEDTKKKCLKWMNDEVGSLLKDCSASEKEIRKKSSLSSSASNNVASDRNTNPSLLNRIFSQRKKNSNVQEKEMAKMDNNNGDGKNSFIDNDNQDFIEQQNIYQRRLLKGSSTPSMMVRRKISNNSGSNQGGNTKNSQLPSCKKFWSMAEFYKLRPKDRELVKQQIVRTMVEYQRKTFYVFEDRDPEIRNFLMRTKCETMNACMQRSRLIEPQQQSMDSKRLLAANREESSDAEDDDDQDGEREEKVEITDDKQNSSVVFQDKVDNTTNSTKVMVNGHSNQFSNDRQVVIEPQAIESSSSPTTKHKAKRRVQFA